MVSPVVHRSVTFGDDDRIHLHGAVDATVVEGLGEVLGERLATGCRQIDLDLSGVESVDEHGLVAVVRAWHEVSARGHVLRLVDPSLVIGPLLAMSGLPTSTDD